MKQMLFVYKNGEAVAIQPKQFCFELAMEGYIADNPNILTNNQLDLTEPEVKGLEIPIDSKHRIDIQMRYANDTTAIVELKNVPVGDGALQQFLFNISHYCIRQRSRCLRFLYPMVTDA